MRNESHTLRNILLAVLVVVIVGLGILIGWLIMDANRKEPGPQAPAESSTTPTPSDEQDAATDEPRTIEFTSPKGVKILLDNWRDDMIVSSPLTLTGKAPGNWSFEASFPVVLTDSDDKILAQEPAQLEGDWMTTENVPFKTTLTFTAPTSDKSGMLILRKDNPTGLPENDDSIEIPIRYL